MNALGLLILLAGGFLISSALQNKSPLATLKSIITDPSQSRTTLTSKGTAYSGGGSFGNGGSVQVDGNGGKSSASQASGGPQAAAAIAFARQQIGDPYKFGGNGPDEWDCSGLVKASYASAGITLPRTTALLVTRGRAVSRAELIPGDLVFPDMGHVGIYTGNGNIIDAPRTGKNVAERPIWAFWTARRVVDDASIGTGGM